MTIHRSPLGTLSLRDISITERVFEGVATRQDDPVLIEGPTGRTLTGQEFMAAVKALAGGLTERGFGKGATVAIMAPNMPEFCTVFHAVAWAGGTVTTVNPTYTAHELNHQLMASAATLLVTVPQLVDTAREGMTDTGVRTLAVIGGADGAAL
jgi:acyl-CoA synthetase (AMP-forming)/AMP-acid ligase II